MVPTPSPTTAKSRAAADRVRRSIQRAKKQRKTIAGSIAANSRSATVAARFDGDGQPSTCHSFGFGPQDGHARERSAGGLAGIDVSAADGLVVHVTPFGAHAVDRQRVVFDDGAGHPDAHVFVRVVESFEVGPDRQDRQRDQQERRVPAQRRFRERV